MDLLKGKRKPAFLFVGSRVTITHLSFLELVYCLCELMWSQGIDLCSFCVLFYVSKRNLTTSLVSVVEWRHHALSYVLRGICLLSFHILRTHTQGPEEMGSKTRRKPLKKWFILTCRAPARIWLAVIDFQNGEQQSWSVGQIRSEEIVYTRSC